MPVRGSPTGRILANMTGGGGAEGPDWIDFGPDPAPPPAPRRRRVLTAAAVVVALAWAGSAALTSSRESSAPPQPTRAPTSSSDAPGPTASRKPATAGPVVIRDTGPFAPGLTGDLFARSYESVFRFELGSGRVTATDGAGVESSGPAAFVAGPDRVIVRPFDSVGGVLVRDGRGAGELAGSLREGGEVIAGPPGFVWISSSERYNPQPRMTLTNLDGRPTPNVVTATGTFSSDGRGNLLLSDVGGVWEVPRSEPRRITTGTVAAVGANHYLLVDCDRRHRCSSYVYDRKTQEQRRLGRADTARIPSGVISPDGRYAALLRYDVDNEMEVLDLTDNRTVRKVPERQDIYQASDVFAWSADSRWLYSLHQGRLTLLEVASGKTITPDLGLPELAQLTLRPAAGLHYDG